jgi:hypothetical protein
MNKICSTKAPLNKREWNVSKCFKRGRAVGYVAGIQKGIKEANESVKKKKKTIEATAQAIVFSKFKQIPVERGTNDLRKATLGILRVPNYRAMSEAQTIQELRNKGITKLIVPRTGR